MSGRRKRRRRRSGDVLIVEDEVSFARVVIAPHFRRWKVKTVHNVPDAIELVGDLTDLRLATVDLDIPGADAYSEDQPGGAGFHVVEHIRTRLPQTRVIVLTAFLTPSFVNTAQRLGAEYLSKDECGVNLRKVAQSMKLAEEARLDDHVIRSVENYAVEKQLSPRQGEILAHAVGGATRKEMMETFGIERTTLKSHIGGILAKTGAAKLDDITRELLARSFRELRRLRARDAS